MKFWDIYIIGLGLGLVGFIGFTLFLVLLGCFLGAIKYYKDYVYILRSSDRWRSLPEFWKTVGDYLDRLFRYWFDEYSGRLPLPRFPLMLVLGGVTLLWPLLPVVAPLWISHLLIMFIIIKRNKALILTHPNEDIRKIVEKRE